MNICSEMAEALVIACIWTDLSRVLRAVLYTAEGWEVS